MTPRVRSPLQRRRARRDWRRAIPIPRYVSTSRQLATTSTPRLAKEGPGQVESSPGFGRLFGWPPALPESMTVNAVGDIDVAGEHLASFLGYLQISVGVGHRPGWAFDGWVVLTGGDSCAAGIRPQFGDPLIDHARHPWQGPSRPTTRPERWTAVPAAITRPSETIMDKFSELALSIRAERGTGDARLPGRAGLEQQAGQVLDGIPVTLIGGDHFTLEDGVPEVWPNDGLVALGSALAEGVSRRCPAHRHSADVSERPQHLLRRRAWPPLGEGSDLESRKPSPRSPPPSTRSSGCRDANPRRVGVTGAEIRPVTPTRRGLRRRHINRHAVGMPSC